MLRSVCVSALVCACAGNELGGLLDDTTLNRTALQPLFAGGAVDCPCIDPWHTIPDNQPSGPANTLHNSSCLLNEYGTCSPADYGSSVCRAWDYERWGGACSPNTLGQPEYCRTPFCYVDPAHCTRPYRTSSLFSNENGSLSFSYETCGYINHYKLETRCVQLEICTIVQRQ